jgi:hypothetical protein
MNRNEKIQDFIKTREQEKKRSFNPVEVPKWEAVVLEPNTTQVFRLLGRGPNDKYRTKSSDILEISRSFIVDDNGKFFPVIWSNDKEWPLSKLYYFLAKYKWDAEANNGKGQPIYDNDGCPLLHRVLTNNQNTKFKTGWRPKKYIIANVIDRKDDWCKENKHSKVIAWSKTDKDNITFFSYGMTSGMFDKICDVVVTETNMMY